MRERDDFHYSGNGRSLKNNLKEMKTRIAYNSTYVHTNIFTYFNTVNKQK